MKHANNETGLFPLIIILILLASSAIVMLFSPKQAEESAISGTAVGQHAERSDPSEAIRAAAEAGDAAAQTKLARMYFERNQAPRNDPEALKWFRKAAGIRVGNGVWMGRDRGRSRIGIFVVRMARPLIERDYLF